MTNNILLTFALQILKLVEYDGESIEEKHMQNVCFVFLFNSTFEKGIEEFQWNGLPRGSESVFWVLLSNEKNGNHLKPAALISVLSHLSSINFRLRCNENKQIV